MRWLVTALSVAYLGAGCAASISQAEHEARLDEDRAGYEGRLADARRQLVRARADETRCERRGDATAGAQQSRVERLETHLAAKELRLRSAEDLAARCGPAKRRPGDRSSRVMPASAQSWATAVAPLPIEVVAVDHGVRIVLGADDLFEEGAVILKQDVRRALDGLAVAIGDADEVVVAAHADGLSSGPPDDGFDAWGLTAARARAVVAALQVAGVDPSRLVLQAHAGYRPRDTPGPDPKHQRRIEVLVRRLP